MEVDFAPAQFGCSGEKLTDLSMEYKHPVVPRCFFTSARPAVSRDEIRVLVNPDIAFGIFQYLLPCDQITAAGVCKAWLNLLNELGFLNKARSFFRRWVPYWSLQQREVSWGLF